MTDCIFCKIVAGEIPSTKIYEDDLCLAFLDIQPVNPGHTLVIPKDHHENILEIPDETLKHISTILKKLGKAVMGGTNASGVNIHISTGKDAGQEVFHAHFHIMPRHSNDGYEPWHGNTYKEGEMQQTADLIKSKIL